MSNGLPLAKGLTLPVDAVTQRLGFLGKPGTGKSYAATLLAELMYGAGAQFIALDPVGIWYGLRLDGKGKGLPVPVFGGLHGDVPLTPTSGALIADLVVDRRLSCILDTSQFEHDAEKARFAAGFANRFFFRMKAAPAAVHLFLEEAQEYVPQNPQRGEEQMLHDFTRIDKLGRNFGIGVSLISQRPQEVNKKVLNLTECLFAFQMTGAHERKAIKEWIASVGADENILTVLPSLAVAHAHAYSPQWLRISETVMIREKRTADVSSTPAVGVSAVSEQPLTPVDLGKIRDAMAATIEKAKAEDPTELRREIQALRSQVTKAQKQASPPIATPVRDEAAIGNAHQQGFEEGRSAMLTAALGATLDFRRSIEKQAGNLHEVLQALRPEPAPRTPITRRPIHTAHLPTRVTHRPERAVAASNGDLKPAERRILNALAAFEELGLAPVARVNAAFFAGYTENGHFNNMLGRLRTVGLVEYPSGNMLALTADGRAHADASAHPIASLEDLHERWLTKLNPSEGRLLRVLIACHPDAMSRAELAEATGYTENGHFNNMLGHLRTLGAIDYPRGQHVAATDVLFPEGLP